MRQLLVANLIVVSLFVLSACGTSSSSSSGAPVYGEMMGAASDVDAVLVRAGRQIEPGASEAPADRKMVRTASMTLAVRHEDDIGPVLDEATSLAERLGGYVASEGPGTITLRIPDRQLEVALDELATVGRETRRDIRTSDVTMQYADLETRLSNAKALQARLRSLLDQAESVQDVLAVEVELARVTTEVERLEGQIRFLANQVAFSTVTLRVFDDVRPGPLGYVVVGAYEAVKWLFVRG